MDPWSPARHCPSPVRSTAGQESRGTPEGTPGAVWPGAADGQAGPEQSCPCSRLHVSVALGKLWSQSCALRTRCLGWPHAKHSHPARLRPVHGAYA